MRIPEDKYPEEIFLELFKLEMLGGYSGKVPWLMLFSRKNTDEEYVIFLNKGYILTDWWMSSVDTHW